jgi:hypothetical protein
VLKEDTAKLYIVGKRKTNGIRIHLSSKSKTAACIKYLRSKVRLQFRSNVGED